METSKKECKGCGEVKPLEAFSKQKLGKFGRKSKCKACVKVYNESTKDSRKGYYEANKERDKVKAKARYEANKDKVLAYQKDYRKKNKSVLSKKYKEFYEANKEQESIRKKAYREENKDKVLAREKAYREENKDKRAAYRKGYHKEKYTTDAFYRMKSIIRSNVARRKACSTIEMIGISFEEFANMYGMGEGMHLDHKIPFSWFDMDNEQHCRACQHHTNLQWLSPEENKSKGNRYANINGQRVLREDFDIEAYVQVFLNDQSKKKAA